MKHLLKLFLLITLISCSGTPKKNVPIEFDYGKIEQNTYLNSFFGLEIPFNSEWYVQSQEEMNKMVKQGEEFIAGDDKLLKRQLNAAKINTAYLFTLFKYKPGTNLTYNPSVMVIAENINKFPQIKEGKDYLEQTKKIMARTQMNYSYEKDIFTRLIGNKKFDVLEGVMHLPDTDITQEFMSTIMQGFTLSFVISYTTESDKEELYNIIDGITL